jgi:hypothetical protein
MLDVASAPQGRKQDAEARESNSQEYNGVYIVRLFIYRNERKKHDQRRTRHTSEKSATNLDF